MKITCFIRTFNIQNINNGYLQINVSIHESTAAILQTHKGPQN